MQTHWGAIEVRDAHMHLFSRAFFEALAEQKGQPGEPDALVAGLGWKPPLDNRTLAEEWANELDRQGVGRSVLMSSLPGHERSAAEVLRARPGRFYGYFMFNPLEEEAARRASHAFDQEGLQGLCLFPAMHGFSVQDDRLNQIFELAAEHPRVLVFVHMGLLTVGIRKKLGLPSRFDMTRSNPLDLHRVALEHPGVNFVIPHFGAGFLRETLMLGDLVENVCLDTSSSNNWVKYLVPDISLVHVFRKALAVYGPDRLLFGSDSSFFPRGWNREIFDQQAEALEELGVEEGTARAIFGGNLKRLLGD